MKQVLNTILQFFEAMGEARAAASLTRQGRIDEAKAIYAK
jgi:hypothetical protein